MPQNYIIFADTKRLEISENNDGFDLYMDNETKHIDRIDRLEKELPAMIASLEQGRIEHLKLRGKDAGKLFEIVCDCYDEKILAAGGLVKNGNGEVLVIFRNGKWDLPKGKAEKDEHLKSAAVREVQEETGLSVIKVTEELPNTYHTYTLNDKRVLKETHWYLMKGEGKLHPQEEEGITKVEWADKKKLDEFMENTYENIRLVLKNGGVV